MWCKNNTRETITSASPLVYDFVLNKTRQLNFGHHLQKAEEVNSHEEEISAGSQTPVTTEQMKSRETKHCFKSSHRLTGFTLGKKPILHCISPVTKQYISAVVVAAAVFQPLLCGLCTATAICIFDLILCRMSFLMQPLVIRKRFRGSNHRPSSCST